MYIQCVGWIEYPNTRTSQSKLGGVYKYNEKEEKLSHPNAQLQHWKHLNPHLSLHHNFFVYIYKISL